LPVEDTDGFIEPSIATTPVPFGVTVISPFAPLAKVILPALVPSLVSIIKSYAPLLVMSPVASPAPTSISPVPLGESLIFPFAPSSNVIFPALVPLFVFKIKSPVPWVVSVALASLSPI
jgi:hypothetical protein